MGYMKIDNRGAGGSLVEVDTTWCRHCQAVLKKLIWETYGGWCSNCFGPLCGLCAKRSYQLGVCENWHRKVDDMVKERDRRIIAG